MEIVYKKLTINCFALQPLPLYILYKNKHLNNVHFTVQFIIINYYILYAT